MLQVAIVILAAFSFLLFLNQMQSQNVMLSEVAESAAREVVELISVYTLGGSNLSYMYLTVPDTLAGQPYSLSIGETSENVLNVTARLQIYQQVRVVVTPNFGQSPVHAVKGSREVGGLTVSDTILLPLPPGYKPAIVAFRDGNSIYVGFAKIQTP